MSKNNKNFANAELIRAIKQINIECTNKYFFPELKNHCDPVYPHDPLIIMAVESGNQAMIHELLLAKADLFQTNSFHWNLFHSLTLYNIPDKIKWQHFFIPQKIPFISHAVEAAVEGKTEYFRQYLANKQSHHLTKKEAITKLQPIHYAAANGHVEIVRLLLKANPDLAYAKCARGNTPMHFAALNDHLDIVKEMVEIHHVNFLKLTDSNGKLPIYHAAYSNCYTVLDYLTQKFINSINFENKTLVSMLQTALVNENQKILSWMQKNVKPLLLKKLINEIQLNSLPLLHYSIYYLKVNISKWLIDNGADMQKIDQFGYTAVKIAQQRKKISLIEYMQVNIKIKLRLVNRGDDCIGLFNRSHFVTLEEFAASKIMGMPPAGTIPAEVEKYLSDFKMQ